MLQCKEDFSRLDDPFMQNMYAINGEEPSCTGITWLPTEQSIVASTYDNGHIVLLDVNTNSIDSVIEASDSAILSVTTHDLKPLIVTSHEDGNIIVTDFKTKQQVGKLDLEHKNEKATSLSFVNNGLSLLVGYVDGSIASFDMNSFKLQSMVNNAHAAKEGFGVNCLLSLDSDKAA